MSSLRKARLAEAEDELQLQLLNYEAASKGKSASVEDLNAALAKLDQAAANANNNACRKSVAARRAETVRLRTGHGSYEYCRRMAPFPPRTCDRSKTAKTAKTANATKLGPSFVGCLLRIDHRRRRSAAAQG